MPMSVAPLVPLLTLSSQRTLFYDINLRNGADTCAVATSSFLNGI